MQRDGLDKEAHLKHIERMYKRAKILGILGIINMASSFICMFAGDPAGFSILMIFSILNLTGASLIATLASSLERIVKSSQDEEERRKKVHELNPHKW